MAGQSVKPDATPAASFTIRAEYGLPHVDTDAWRQGQAAKASTQHTSSATSTAIDRRVRLWVHDREASENFWILNSDILFQLFSNSLVPDSYRNSQDPCGRLGSTS